MRPALPDLYTIDELMERYPFLSRDTLYELLNSGELRGFKIGRAWNIAPEDWADFIERRREAYRDDRPDDAADAPAASSGPTRRAS